MTPVAMGERRETIGAPHAPAGTFAGAGEGFVCVAPMVVACYDLPPHRVRYLVWAEAGEVAERFMRVQAPSVYPDSVGG